MSWTTEQVEKLIEGYSNHPELFAVKHPEYHNKNKRQLALNCIIKDVNGAGTSIIEVQKKWNGLRTTYINEKKKVLQSIHSGAGEDEIYTPKLWYFKKLEFLNDHLSLRQATSSSDPYNDITTDSNIASQTSSNFLLQDDRTLLLSPSSTPISQAAASFNKNDSLQEDEDVLYGKYVATRLKNITSLTKKIEIKHKIDQLLFEDQMTELY